jgi:RNA polymerase sigma factor (sigma-70 family)
MSEVAAVAGFNRLLSDERLTRRAVGGDDRAFGTIFRRYHQPLYRFCLAIVGNPEDAQDALQNTMIKVLRALPGEERKIELKPWLYRIARNESIDLLRRRRETRQLDAEQAELGPGLAEDAATRERLRRLVADLKELPDRQREVLVMRELAGLDFAEIGSALDTSGAVARQTLYEARQSLHQMEEGREMRCDAVMQALSDGDGRITRRRDVRAHLRACAGCRGFRDEIKARQHDFAALSPLPALAAAGMLQGLVGGSQAASGGGLAAVLGGGAAKTVGASAAAKGVATVAVVAAVGVTAADRSGVIHLGLPGEGGAKSAKEAPGAGGAGAAHREAGPRVGDAAPARSGGGKHGPGLDQAKGDGAAAAAMGEQLPAHVPGAGEGRSAVESHPASRGGVPAAEHAPGHEHGGVLPPPADAGQETAESHKPPLPDAATGVAGEEGGEAVTPPQPTEPSPPASTPGSPPSSAPGSPPVNSPKSAPESPPHAPPASPPAAPPKPAPAKPPAAAPASQAKAQTPASDKANGKSAVAGTPAEKAS